jgi:PIN domain nuclease of toxin-antitoxin system
MRSYILDTHALIWLLDGNSELPKQIREDIEYYQNKYSINEISILETIQLQQLPRIKLSTPIVSIFNKLKELNIEIIKNDIKVYLVLEKIPMLTFNGNKHSDPFDRIIIASSIKNNYELISHDGLMKNYTKYGLKVIEI